MNGSLIPGTSAHFNRLFETSSSPRVTASEQILNMTFSSEICRRLDFDLNILDEPDERISGQEIEVSVPTCKRRISNDLSEEDSNSVSLATRQ